MSRIEYKNEIVYFSSVKTTRMEKENFHFQLYLKNERKAFLMAGKASQKILMKTLGFLNEKKVNFDGSYSILAREKSYKRNLIHFFL